MFIVTQLIGIYVVKYYLNENNKIPYGMETPDIEEEIGFYKILPSIIFAFIIAISLVFILTKFNVAFILKLWFFIVVIIALGISFNSFMPELKYSSLIALLLALPLSYIKIYRRDFLVHNFTELLIYPGIASVFVPIFSFWTIIILLVIISVYDVWAVWYSGIMQKMAKYQINQLKIFSGFFVPYVSKKVRMQINKMKKTMSKSELKNKKIKVHIAVLGGGDVVFPIITAGVLLKTSGLMPALFVIGGASLGLLYLFFFAEKKKFYPAMPFITSGIFAGIILSYLIL